MRSGHYRSGRGYPGVRRGENPDVSQVRTSHPLCDAFQKEEHTQGGGCFHGESRLLLEKNQIRCPHCDHHSRKRSRRTFQGCFQELIVSLPSDDFIDPRTLSVSYEAACALFHSNSEPASNPAFRMLLSSHPLSPAKPLLHLLLPADPLLQLVAATCCCQPVVTCCCLLDLGWFL